MVRENATSNESPATDEHVAMGGTVHPRSLPPTLTVNSSLQFDPRRTP